MIERCPSNCRCPFDQASVKRSLVDRGMENLGTDGTDVFRRNEPHIEQSEIVFPYGKYQADLAETVKRPCPKSKLFLRQIRYECGLLIISSFNKKNDTMDNVRINEDLGS